MDNPDYSPSSYDRKVKTVLAHLEQRGVPLDPERWYAAHREVDAQAKGAGDHEARAALVRLEHLPLLTRGDGRLHPSWEVTASTGRIAAVRPPVQLIPKGPLRAAIGDGRRLALCLDWSSSHPAILASLSGDAVLSDDCAKGELYQRVAEAAGCELGAAKLSILKMMNGGAPTVDGVRGLFTAGGRYAVAGAWMRATVDRARSTGKVSVEGRMFPLGDPGAAHTAIAAVLQRIEVQALISAAHELLSFAGAELVMAVHDELVMLCEPSEIAVKAARSAGERAMSAGMREAGVTSPPKVSARVGWSWGEAADPTTTPPARVPTVAPTLPRCAWSARGLDAVKLGEGLTSAGDVYGLMVAAVDRPADLRVALASSPGGADFRRSVTAYVKLAQDRSKGIRESADVAPPRFARGSQVELAQALQEHYATGEGEGGQVVYDGAGVFYSDGGLWREVTDAELSRVVQGWDGVAVGDEDDDKPRALKLGANDVAGAVSLFHDRVSAPSFFAEQTGGVLFRDRILLSSGEVRPIYPEDRLRAREALDLDYAPGAGCPRWLAFLREVWRDNEDVETRIAYLQEWLGAALWGEATKHRGLPVLTGDGENGKSVCVNAIQSLFPSGAQSTVNLSLLSGPKGEYYAMSLYGKRLNAVSDLPKTHVEDTGTFKAAVMGEPITGRDPAGRPLTFSPRAAWILALNTAPAVSDASRGFWSRVKVLTFDRTFIKGVDMDPGLKDALTAERGGMILWALEGLRRLRAQGGYTDPASSAAQVDEWRESSDNVAAYVAAKVRVEGAVVVKVSAAHLYQHYKSWCEAEGFKNQVTSITFGKRLATLGGASWRTFTAAIPGTGKTEAVRVIPHLEIGVPYSGPAH